MEKDQFTGKVLMNFNVRRLVDGIKRFKI